jgi:hypothetical protein
MGHTSYSYSDRSERSVASGYHTKHVDAIFKQNVEKRIHESMEPSKALLREARDSAAHPNTVPIILALDVTGSMGRIPHDMVKNGLPHMMSSMIQNGVKDATLLFLAVGDHTCDSAPLQVGQFESGDAELDTWLTRTWLEGRGGANEGESYSLAHYFAAFHTSIDSFEKRGKKGFLFTIGDEPSINNIPANVIKEIMGDGAQKNFTDHELLEAARKKYHVFHLHVLETSSGSSRDSLEYWQQLMGDHRIPVIDSHDIPSIISETVIRVCKEEGRLNNPVITINEPDSNVSSVKPSVTDDQILL